MIDFTSVSREFRSLVTRRRDLVTFLGSVFAALGLFLQTVLQQKLPPSLGHLQEHVFAFYALMLMVPSLILALRMAKLHAGMVLNGILYARLMQEQDFTARGDPRRAGQHNFLGVSFLQFLLADLMAGFSAAILALALTVPLPYALAIGVSVVVVWLALYMRFHHQAVRFALHKIGTEDCAPFPRKEWEKHVSASLEQANQGLIAEIAFAGLIVFSVFESLSSLSQISESVGVDLAPDDVKQYGPLIYSALMLVTCLFEMVIYLRIRVAIGRFCLQIDPADRPFRPLKLTDSLLGYLLLAFLFVVSLHMTLTLIVPDLARQQPLLLGIDAVALGLAILAEQLTLIVAGQRIRR